MGREAAITYEQVAAAADAMKESGAKPTSRAIRERLGNVGSMGTINKMLQEWKAGQERRITNALAFPPVLQRAIFDFIDQELTSAKANLEAELAEQQQEGADLATENERQMAEIKNKTDNLTAAHAKLATLHGRNDQMEKDLAVARDEADRERKAAEAARTELAKTLLRLDAMPRLEADLATSRSELEKERQLRVAAEQQVAVLVAKLEAATERVMKAEIIATEASVQARKSNEAITLETNKTETAQNTISNLTGKLDALERQIQQQISEMETVRDYEKKAREEAAELRGRLAASS